MINYSNKKNKIKKIIGLTVLIICGTLSGIAQPLVADGGLSQTICNGSSTTIGGAPTANFGTPGYTYSWAPAAGLSSTTVSNPTANPTSTTTYTITVTDVALAVATSTVTVTVNPLPATPAPSSSSPICEGTNLNLTGPIVAGGSYSWVGPNSFTSTLQNPVIPAASILATGTYTLTVTASGCTSLPGTTNAVVNPTPIATSTPSSQTICSTQNANLNLSSSVAGTSYSWVTTNSGVSGMSAGVGSIINQTLTATTTSPGTVTYYVTPTAAGCSGSLTNVIVTVNPVPVATVTSSPLTRCSGDTVSFSVSSNVAGTTFTWATGITNVSGVSPTSGVGTSVFDTLSATTFSAGTVAYLFTPTAAGCTGSAVFPFVTVNPYPDADFSYSSSGCQFSPNALPSFLPGASAGTFTSMPAGLIINPSTGEIDLTSSPVNSYLVTNTLTAAGGCPSVNANHGFTISPLPNITAFPSSYSDICSGGLVSISFSSGVAGTTYAWTSSEMGTSGSALSGTGNISEFLSASLSAGTTTYTITPTAGACVGTSLIYPVNVNPTPDPNFSLATPACQYAPNAFPSVSGTIGIFSATPAGLVINPTTGEIDLTTSAVGTYDITNTIAAAGGCPVTSQTYTGYTISPFVDPTITDILPVCFGDAPFNFVAASAGGTWLGAGITNAALGTFDPTIAGPGTFTITHQSSGPCSFAYTDTTAITVTAGDLNGKVTYSGGDLNSGANTAVLFNYSSTFASFDTVQVSSIDALGYYNFTSVYPGDYLIKVFADTLVYPLLVPTYYDNEYLWDTALVMTHGCVTDTANVLMVEGIVTSGPGLLSGNVSEGFGFVALASADGFARIPGEPIPGIDVKLGRNPGGQMMTNTQTDPLGNYAFTNIPINVPGYYYTVYVDIPGLGRDSVYNVTVTATDTVFTQLDYLADSNSVYPIYPVNVSVGNIAKEAVTFSVYPNPTNTTSTVSYVLKTASTVKLEVYDVLGKKLETPVNTNQAAGTYKINLAQLKAGVYFVNLNINNNSNTVRLVVID